MVSIRLKGIITETGELGVQLPEGLPPGEVQVTIEVRPQEEVPWEERPWTDEEIRELTKVAPKTGAEIVAAGHIGGWEDDGITDSVAWVEEQRRKRAEQRKW
ncbi:MAG: hypothetical protein HZC41_01750 [Chloroflexi bacterium]|nr:hypothetical protein [Chloroflexota bacterium]